MHKHEVFVSYKFSDASNTRDKIIKKLENHGHYYRGEKGYCRLELATESLKQYLSDMIFGTSVTVVIISPEVTLSNWVDWEIKYSLRKTTRSGIQSQRNGIVCVIQSIEKLKYDYLSRSVKFVSSSDWAYYFDGGRRKLQKTVFPKAIVANMQDTFSSYNYFSYLDSNETNLLLDDYCVVVSESTFLSNPDKYIEEAFRRAHSNGYDIKINC